MSFDPSIGGEVQKTRPAAIISNDASNKSLNRVQVVSLSSQIGRIFPSEAAVAFDGKRGKAMADQIATVSKTRLLRLAGKLSNEDMLAVEKAI